MPERGLWRPAPPSDVTSPSLDEIRAVLLQFFQDNPTSLGPTGATSSQLSAVRLDMSAHNRDEVRAQLRQFFEDHTESRGSTEGVISRKPGPTSNQLADGGDMSTQHVDELRALLSQYFQDQTASHGPTGAPFSQLPADDHDMSTPNMDELRELLRRFFQDYSTSRGSIEEASCMDISHKSGETSSQLPAKSRDMHTQNLDQTRALLRQFFQDHLASRGPTNGACCRIISQHEPAAPPCSQSMAPSRQHTGPSSQLEAHSRQHTGPSSQLEAHSRQHTGPSSQLEAHSRQHTRPSSQLEAHSSQSPAVLGRDMATQTQETDTIHGQTGIPTINEVIPSVKLADVLARNKRYLYQMYEDQPLVQYNKPSIIQYLTAGTHGVTGPDTAQTEAQTGDRAGCSHWHTTSSQTNDHLKTTKPEGLESCHHLTATQTVSTQTATVSAIEAASLCLGTWWQSGHITDPQSQPRTDTDTLTDMELIQLYMSDLEDIDAMGNGEVEEDMDISDALEELSNSSNGSLNVVDMGMRREVLEDGLEDEAYQTEATENDTTEDIDVDEVQWDDGIDEEYSQDTASGMLSTGQVTADYTADGICQTSDEFLWYNGEIYGQIFRDIYPTARLQHLLKSPKTTPWSVASREPTSPPGQPVSVVAFMNAGCCDTAVGGISDAWYQTHATALEPQSRLINNRDTISKELIQGTQRPTEELNGGNTEAVIGSHTMNWVFGEYRRAIAENALNERRDADYTKSAYTFNFRSTSSFNKNQWNNAKNSDYVHPSKLMDADEMEYEVKRYHEEMETEDSNIEADYEGCEGNHGNKYQLYECADYGGDQENTITGNSIYDDTDDAEEDDTNEEAADEGSYDDGEEGADDVDDEKAGDEGYDNDGDEEREEDDEKAAEEGGDDDNDDGGEEDDEEEEDDENTAEEGDDDGEEEEEEEGEEEDDVEKAAEEGDENTTEECDDDGEEEGEEDDVENAAEEDDDDDDGDGGEEEEEEDDVDKAAEEGDDDDDDDEEEEEEDDVENAAEEGDDDGEVCDDEDDADDIEDDNDDDGDYLESDHESNDDSDDDSNNGACSNNTARKENCDTDKNDGNTHDNDGEGGSGCSEYKNNGEDVKDNEQQFTDDVIYSRSSLQYRRGSVTDLREKNGLQFPENVRTHHSKKRKSISPLAPIRIRRPSDAIHAYSTAHHQATVFKYDNSSTGDVTITSNVLHLKS